MTDLLLFLLVAIALPGVACISDLLAHILTELKKLNGVKS